MSAGERSRRYEHSRAESRVRRTLANMPFGGPSKLRDLSEKIGFDGALYPAPMANETGIAAIADYLEELGNVLRERATEGANAVQQLQELRCALKIVGATMLGRRT